MFLGGHRKLLNRGFYPLHLSVDVSIDAIGRLRKNYHKMFPEIIWMENICIFKLYFLIIGIQNCILRGI